MDVHYSWQRFFVEQAKLPYWQGLNSKLSDERMQHQIYPQIADVFNAFDLAPFEHVRVVILGQDPYHGVGQAMGLSFSVPSGCKMPPSLANIAKELKSDLGITLQIGDLGHWARQGVLLLNTCLSVRKAQPGSHAKLGWSSFSDNAIIELSNHREHIVFVLWGSHAQTKASLIDDNKHLIISSVHPSPLSAHRGFFGSKPFSTTNNYLVKHNIVPIKW
jgi:uracil-DNA glycosylase